MQERLMRRTDRSTWGAWKICVKVGGTSCWDACHEWKSERSLQVQNRKKCSSKLEIIEVTLHLKSICDTRTSYHCDDQPGDRKQKTLRSDRIMGLKQDHDWLDEDWVGPSRPTREQNTGYTFKESSTWVHLRRLWSKLYNICVKYRSISHLFSVAKPSPT